MVPATLRLWFIVHFAIDVIFAIPLLLVPKLTLSIMGWTTVDPMTSRLVGAALMGIGIESLLGCKATAEVFRAMLNLKIIWSLSAIFAISITLFQGGPIMGWFFLIIFLGFCCLWIYYRVKISNTVEQ